MLESLGEVPTVDEAFYYAFCHKKKELPRSSLMSAAARKEFLEAL